MKKLTVLAFVGAALLFTACNDKKDQVKDAQEVAEKTGETYKADIASSNVNWKAYHKGGLKPRWGTLNLESGEITVADNAVTSGDFVIDMKSLKVDPASVTEADKKASDLEDHLKNQDFFDVTKNPTSEFKITSVEDLSGAAPEGAVEGSNKTISGNLTLIGKTMNVTFPAKVTVVDGKASIDGKFTVNRSDWGVKFGTDNLDPAEWLISKDFDVNVKANFVK